MAKTYKFKSYDSEDDVTVSMEFTTENDAWSGYDGPMWQFFNFLKGNGFVFNHNSEIGVMIDDEFRSATDDSSPINLFYSVSEAEGDSNE
jgi:hypothetical protein